MDAHDFLDSPLRTHGEQLGPVTSRESGERREPGGSVCEGSGRKRTGMDSHWDSRERGDE